MGDTLDVGEIEERLRRNLGRGMFAARWLMAPIYIGLLFALALIVVKFVQVLVQSLPGFLQLSSKEAIFFVLNLVDMSLVANLVVIMIFAGWENFVGRLLSLQPGDQPAWLGGLDFSTLKLRLIGSIVAIITIEILETFMHVGEVPVQQAAWQLAILLGIGLVGVLLALTDRLSSDARGKK